jgi:hypothetical protein
MSSLQCTIGMDRVIRKYRFVTLTRLMESYLDNIQKLAAEARIRLSAAPTPGYSDSVTFDGHVRTENGVREAAFAGLRSD